MTEPAGDPIAAVAAQIECDATGCRLAKSSPYERSPPRYT